MGTSLSAVKTAVLWRMVAWVAIVSAVIGVVVPAHAQSGSAVGDPHESMAVAPQESKFNTSQSADMQWYREAGLGMFIHWGISSVEAKHELSWAMLANIPWNRNVLANFAPRPSGEMPASVYRCLADVQTWMAGHRESVVGVLPGPYPDRSNVPVTVRGKTWYLHLLPKTADGPAFAGSVSLRGVGKPKRVVMLGTGRGFDSRLDGDSLAIAVPKELRTALVDVIAVDW